MARPAALALLAFALALSVAAPAQAGWQAPFRVAGPYSLDVQPMQTAFSAGGQAALGYNVFNEDRSLASQGYAAISGKNGRPGAPVRVPDTQEVLDLAFDGNNLDLLIGTSPALRPCCSSARLVKIAGGKPQRPRLIFPRLTGATVGQLIALPGNRLLSSVATAQAVWTELTGDKGRPAPARAADPEDGRAPDARRHRPARQPHRARVDRRGRTAGALDGRSRRDHGRRRHRDERAASGASGGQGGQGPPGRRARDRPGQLTGNGRLDRELE